MSNVTWSQVQALHFKIPDEDNNRITDFISDAEAIVKAKLSPYVTMWTDATEPEIVKVIVKHMACWSEMRFMYAEQVLEEAHEWIRDFKELPWELLHEMIDILDNGGVPEGFTAVKSSPLKSNTQTFKKIFTLQDWEAQGYHPEDDDKRYGED